jgi:uncharacterized protein
MLYLDTSVVLPLFVSEPGADAVRRWFAALPADELTISDWTTTEFVSAIGIKVRTHHLERPIAEEIVRTFYRLADDSLSVLVPDRDDFLLSSRYLERFELGLRAGDALHLAIASRHGARKVYSFDRVLIKSAQKLRIKAQIPL